MKPMPKTILRKINVFLLSVILACTMLPVHADAAYEIPGICQVQTDTGAAGTVKTMDYNYDRNTYFSLRDIAMLLSSGKTAKTRTSPCGATSLKSAERRYITTH